MTTRKGFKKAGLGLLGIVLFGLIRNVTEFLFEFETDEYYVGFFNCFIYMSIAYREEIFNETSK